ncbi:aldolase/citrate lyase family protein [Variovorax sp. JS1663]|uniref:aldolase/citrate lyase family protein n=1 Tax=Variovorax sp. JS1663 TaxID=1851577 RepID=UPI000B347D72|nr:aldolase/citrate lyase family protein [Variovorax sp. JS1663]OUM02616.1 hypothetical protein A8M77_10125 [Variovorax sp. JS1663]
MPEQWINPVAWAPKLIDQLMGRGWKTFQLDLEGGLLSDDTIGWAIGFVQARGAELVARVPADQLPLMRQLARHGVGRFLVPGCADAVEVEALARGLRAQAPSARIVAMIESLSLMREVPQIARVEGVGGVHFGLVDLCREMGIARWRDADQLPREVLDRAGEARALGLTAGSYMLPAWRGTPWPAHFDVLSHLLAEFAVPGSAAAPRSN